jgi:hypothetical protein
MRSRLAAALPISVLHVQASPICSLLAATAFLLGFSDSAVGADGLRITHIDLRHYPTVELTV